MPKQFTTRDVVEFLRRVESQYLEELERIRGFLTAQRKLKPSLNGVYSIYSRGDKQQGRELKTVQKIRIKANKYCHEKNLNQYVLLEMPDIVGLTVSVLFPSDIKAVASVIDEAVDQGVFKALNAKPSTANPERPFDIATRHGTPRSIGGYHACHYYLKAPTFGNGPIVEVQIKTVLDDAWATKAQELTYKNTLQLTDTTRLQFTGLGNLVHHIDEQSDAVRHAVLRDNAALTTKKRFVQLDAIFRTVEGQLANFDDVQARTVFEQLKGFRFAGFVDPLAVPTLCDQIAEVYARGQNERPAACGMMTALATISPNEAAKSRALNQLNIWEVEAVDDAERLLALQFTHLTHYALGEIAAAIDAAEDAEVLSESLPVTESVRIRLLRRRNSITSSLAYYHADIIGTSDGDRRQSHNRATAYLAKSLGLLSEAGIVPHNVLNSRDVAACLVDNDDKHRLFNSADNATYVEIRTAQTSSQVREVLSVINQLRTFARDMLKEDAPPLCDLHEHAATRRLMELEAAEAMT